MKFVFIRNSLPLVLFLSLFMHCYLGFGQNKKKLTIAEIPLTWANFTPVNTNDTQFSAKTLINYSMNWTSKGVQGAGTLELTVHCTAALDKNGTAVKTSILNSNETGQKEDLLEHEKGHWLIALIQLQRLSAGFSMLPLTKNYKVEIDSFFKQSYRDYRAEQTLYDQETNHGLNRENQLKWEESLLVQAAQYYDEIKVPPVDLMVTRTVYLN